MADNKSGSHRDKRSSGGRSSGGRSGRDRGRTSGGRSGGSRQSSGGKHEGRSPDRRGREGDRSRQRRPITLTAGGDLPRWVREEITRSTPKDRRDAALNELQTGLTAYVEERYKQAVGSLRKAKDLSPRAATVREVLGLSAYNLEGWEEALRELRTFRRIAGDTTHMAVEMDCLRALGRDRDIDKVWELFGEHGGSREAEDEIRVVYASHLLDNGRIADAWRVIKPGRLVANPTESAVRRWAVAARVASDSGDPIAAHKLLEAIRKADPEIEWLGDLERQLEL